MREGPFTSCSKASRLSRLEREEEEHARAPERKWERGREGRAWPLSSPSFHYPSRVNRKWIWRARVCIPFIDRHMKEDPFRLRAFVSEKGGETVFKVEKGGNSRGEKRENKEEAIWRTRPLTFTFPLTCCCCC